MRNLYKILPYTLLLNFYFVTYSYAQLESLGFHFRANQKKQIKIEYKQHNNLIVIPVKINDIDTLNFVLDTGVGYTIITDPTVMDKLGMECLRSIKIAGTGVGTELKGCISNVASIRLKGIEALNHNVIVLEEDVLRLSSYAGVKIHGLIGYDLFSRFVVKINYLTRMLTFIQPDHFTYNGKGQVFPISIEQMKPYLQAEAVLSNQSAATPIKLVLDTGAGHSLSLETGTHPHIQIPEKNITSQLGMTLNGSVEGAIGRIDKFKIGTFELQKVITSFPDSASLRFFRGINNRHGNLGCGVLKRFHITFDYPHQKVILQKNKKFKEPFEFNTSGVDLIAEPPEYDKYIVASVRKNSPADEAGLKKGDKLIAVDDNVTSKLRMEEIYNFINKKEGKITTLFVQRDKLFLVLQLKLKQAI